MNARYKQWAGSALLIALVGLVAGCASPPVPQDQFYRVQIALPASAPAPLLNGILEVERLSADGLTAARNIVYVEEQSSHVLASYHYHFWVEPPTVMVRDQLVAYLRGLNAASAVVTPEMRANPAYVVTGKILRLERIIGDHPRGIVEIELALRESTNDRIALVRTYREETPVEGGRVGDAVIALNRSLERIFKAFAADVAAL